MKYFLILVSLVATEATASDYVWNTECDTNQIALNQCAQDKFRFYENKLRNLYEKQVNHLSGPYSKGKYKKYLKNAQHAWQDFREMDCTYEAGKPRDSGSMWGFAYNSCMTDRTKTRIEEIQKYIECRENGCPY